MTPETGLLHGLSEYGATGVMLAAVSVVFLWAFRRLFDRVLVYMDRQGDTQDKIIDALKVMSGKQDDLREEVQRNHSDLLERLELRKTPVRSFTAVGTKRGGGGEGSRG